MRLHASAVAALGLNIFSVKAAANGVTTGSRRLMDDVDVKVPLETEAGGEDVLVGWTESEIDVVIETEPAPAEDRMRRSLVDEESLAEFVSDESGCLTRVILGDEVYDATTGDNCEVLSLTPSETRRERRVLQEADPFIGDIACSDLPAITGCENTGKCVSIFDTVCNVTFPTIRGLLGVTTAVFPLTPRALELLNRAVDKFESLCPVASRGICSAVCEDPTLPDGSVGGSGALLDEVDASVPLPTDVGNDVVVQWVDDKVDVVVDVVVGIAEFVTQELQNVLLASLGPEAVYSVVYDGAFNILEATPVPKSELPSQSRRRVLQSANPVSNVLACFGLDGITFCDDTLECTETLGVVCDVTFPVLKGLLGVGAAVFNPTSDALAVLSGAVTKLEELCPVAGFGICSAICEDSAGLPVPTTATQEPVTTELPGFIPDSTPEPRPFASACPPGSLVCADPHLQGLRGQKFDWSGVDGGWYNLIKDDDLLVNCRVTAPLPVEFPNRQLMTGISIVSGESSLVIEVRDPYTVDTDGCPEGQTPCLADGGLRALVNGEEVNGLLRPSRNKRIAGQLEISASNLPYECRQFGGDRTWARMFNEMMEGRRKLAAQEERFEDWVLRFDHMAAPDWCAKFIAEKDLDAVQSDHAIFRILTTTSALRLNVGTNTQGGDGETDWDGRVLPDLDFWQMDVGMSGLDLDSPSLSGLLGETARLVFDDAGRPVMEGPGAFRGTIEDYRVSGPLAADFSLLDKKD